MTKDEALKLALEALELHGKQYPHMVKGYCLDAITAIKEALAQPEQDGQCKRCADGCPACDARKLPKQEPVGWAEHGVINWLADKQFNHTSFLYDTPAQITWVGLTDEDELDWDGGDLKSLVKAIEAKLKEKNNA